MEKSYPKVSCLCVTSNRVEPLKTAVACFKAQTYPNKELLVVYDRNDIATDEYISSLNDPEIRAYKYYNGRKTLTLGDIRNISIKEAGGEYFCMWDDDDWHHQERLASQMDHLFLSGKMASVLFLIIVFDNINKRGFLSAPRPWEATILCHKNFAINNGVLYDPLRRGEDTGFIHRLVALDAVYPIFRPQLYIYNYTGSNTWDKTHFERVFSHSRLLPRKNSAALTKVVETLSIKEGSELLDHSAFAQHLSYQTFIEFFLKNIIWYDKVTLND
jgi:glycosyltransferase involved in cell wall biosynthesis